MVKTGDLVYVIGEGNDIFLVIITSGAETQAWAVLYNIMLGEHHGVEAQEKLVLFREKERAGEFFAIQLADRASRLAEMERVGKEAGLI